MPEFELQQRSPSETCPLCREVLGEDSLVTTCEACGTAVHAQCDQEFRSGCPTIGCRGTRRRTSADERHEESEEGSGYRRPSELQRLLASARLFLAVALLAGGLLALLCAMIFYMAEGEAGVLQTVGLGVILLFAGWGVHPDRSLSNT